MDGQFDGDSMHVKEMYRPSHLDEGSYYERQPYGQNATPERYDRAGASDYPYRSSDHPSPSTGSRATPKFRSTYPPTDTSSSRQDNPPYDESPSLPGRDDSRMNNAPLTRGGGYPSNSLGRVDQPSSVAPRQETDQNGSMQSSRRTGPGNKRTCVIDITVQIGGNRREPQVTVSSDNNQSNMSIRSTRRVENCAMLDISMDAKDHTAQISTDGIIRD